VWNTVTGEWITYDDPTSISIKRNYAASMGMLGMMVWEVEYDTDAGILMSYMN
jgi:GH18 family chitinase